MTKKQLPKGRLERWILLVQEFQPILSYIKGCDNRIPDFLSRIPVEQHPEGMCPTKKEREQLDIEAKVMEELPTWRQERIEERRVNLMHRQLCEERGEAMRAECPNQELVDIFDYLI